MRQDLGVGCRSEWESRLFSCLFVFGVIGELASCNTGDDPGGALPARQSVRARRPVAAALIGAAVVVVAAALFAYDPAEGNALPGCVFHDLAGLYCPGCGSCRALHQVLSIPFVVVCLTQ
ncbi:MAG: DUF2752 domain-containing protein [Comamonadaceae bacterium]|nr:DUF2752 domain-containing protein [Comamonadaceae bacterium]